MYRYVWQQIESRQRKRHSRKLVAAVCLVARRQRCVRAAAHTHCPVEAVTDRCCCKIRPQYTTKATTHARRTMDGPAALHRFVWQVGERRLQNASAGRPPRKGRRHQPAACGAPPTAMTAAGDQSAQLWHAQEYIISLVADGSAHRPRWARANGRGMPLYMVPTCAFFAPRHTSLEAAHSSSAENAARKKQRCGK